MRYVKLVILALCVAAALLFFIQNGRPVHRVTEFEI